jgi:lauroyl/myristoyl acyltransferase
MRIAMETGATVLPTFAVGGSNGSRIRVVIGAPLQIDRQGATRSQLLRTNVERFARLLDGYIVQYPHLYNVWSKDQWFETRLARSRKRVSERY